MTGALEELGHEPLVRELCDAMTVLEIVGEAAVVTEISQRIASVAKSSGSVLITGETGTGKELVARAIHYSSPRSRFPFVCINCGSFKDELLEDMLFGHERGAFTGAHASRRGLLAEAEHGTLLLDEIDTLSPRAQASLLRVLQERRFRSIGSNYEQVADVRIVAATNAPLQRFTETEAFRRDLYYRLCVFSLHLPALRERKTDIPLLSRHFLSKHAPAGARPELSSAAYEALMRYDWPGNVRELENAILRGIFLCNSGVIAPEHLDLPFCADGGDAPELGPLRLMKQEVVRAFERDYLRRLMLAHSGNITAAARTAGKERRELGKLLKRYSILPNAGGGK
ncbi:MAG TPA: sigma-54 dependent transcriptional regulator [Polyangiaceae bacterium]|nr:sigma-54 dependent transcriptional regulator [Polyangiaceae bacterium]